MLGPDASSGVGQATGFALNRDGQSTTDNIDSALARNRSVAAAGGNQSAVVSPTPSHDGTQERGLGTSSL